MKIDRLIDAGIDATCWTASAVLTLGRWLGVAVTWVARIAVRIFKR